MNLAVGLIDVRDSTKATLVLLLWSECARMTVKENDLRVWLKGAWAKGEKDLGLQWIEPAIGSSVGFPDVLMPVWPAFIPVELKVSERNKAGAFACEVRPVQRRFHLFARKSNYFTCFLIAEGERNAFNVWLAHNSFSPWENNEQAGECLIASKQTINATISRVTIVHELMKLMRKHNQVLLQVPN